MTKAPRKSIVANFGLLSAELENSGTTVAQPAPSPLVAGRVGAGVVGAAHRAIDDIRSERDQLKALLDAGGGAVRDLDTSLIDPSPYPDRLPDDDAGDFETFKRSIESDGQKVPIQVRKHPSASGRYQIVYGHRRWLAAKALGRSVRAIEVTISDLDLVVAQGIENASRQDLTWIERALFDSRMDDAGIKPRDIYAALSIEDAELARMRSVYRAVPMDVIEAIGRAPKVGRPRWLEFAKMISADATGLDAVRVALAATGDKSQGSDQRFQRALGTLKPAAIGRRDPISIADAQGTRLGAVLVSPREVRISAEGTLGTEFLRFIEKQLPDLARQFTRQQDNEKP